MKASNSFPPAHWLNGMGFQINILENGCIHSFNDEKEIDLLWIPLGIKNPAAIKHYQLIIHEDVWRCRPHAVKTRIHSLLNINKRIHGRQCTIRRVDKFIAEKFLNEYHTGGYVSGYYKYGLFYKDELMACATFSKKRKFKGGANQVVSAELLRFAVKDGYYVAGGLHKIITFFFNDTDVNHLMTYADKEWTSGGSYEKIGFTAQGESPPLSFSVNPITFKRTLLKDDSTALAEEGYLVSNLGNRRFVLTK